MTTMPTAVRGLLAGLIASAALALLMLLSGALGLAPELSTVRLLGTVALDLFGCPATPLTGWSWFFLIGAVWGLVFAWIRNRLPGARGAVRGTVFGAGAWVVMMLVFMPVAGVGWFGLEIGPAAPVLTLLGHLIFGAVMGLCFVWLRPAAAPELTTGRPR